MLPTNRTLAHRLQALKFLPRILTDVIDLLKTKAEGMQDIEKDCSATRRDGDCQGL